MNQAIKKIEEAMQDCKETRVPAEPIAEYLKAKCREDEAFAALVIQEHKTLDKCFAFVYEQARKHLEGKNGWIKDNDVFAMAADYFALDDAELERQKSEEEKKKKEEKLKQENEQKQKESEAKKLKVVEVKRKKTAKNIDENQLSLF